MSILKPGYNPSGLTMKAQRAPSYMMGKENKMPLIKGKSKEVQEENFHELKEAHPKMPNKQRVAIVLSTARKSGAHIPMKHARHKEHR